jgi:hypothetical protein
MSGAKFSPVRKGFRLNAEAIEDIQIVVHYAVTGADT